MARSLRLLPSALRDLDALDPPVYRRLKAAILRLAREPRPSGALKLTGEEGYRLRIGDYRVLYRIDDASSTMFVYRVKHRREAYR